MSTVDQVKHFIDGLNISVVIYTLLGYLPQATAVLSFLWICIRLYETKTIQTLIDWLLGRSK